MIMETRENYDYVVKLDGSGRLSKHTRRHLRPIRALDSVPPQYTPSYAGHRAGDAPADDESKKYYESKKHYHESKKYYYESKKPQNPMKVSWISLSGVNRSTVPILVQISSDLCPISVIIASFL